MLRTTIIDNKTFDVLQQLFAVSYIHKHFGLAGGTGLALQIGHRRSIDLDFFAPLSFVMPSLQDALKKKFKESYVPVKNSRVMFFARIDGIKTDFVKEPRPLIEKFILHDNLKLFSVPDIAAMKLHTICGRGKKKDFFDIYALMQLYTWEELKDFFVRKYSEYELIFLYRSIQYFDDAEKEPDIKGINPYNVQWPEIKKFIIKNCR